MTVSATPALVVPPRKLFLSLQLRLMLALSLSFLVLFVVLFAVLLKVLEGQQLSQAQSDLRHVLQKAVSQANGDDLAGLYGLGNELVSEYWKDPSYLKSFAGLRDISDTDPRAFPFAYVQQDGQFKLVASAAGHAAALPDAPATALAAGLNPATEGAFVTPSPLNQDGYFLIGTLPIKNAAGEVICAMGMRFAIDYVYNAYLQVRAHALQVMVGLYLALLVLFSWISRHFSRPVAVLASEVQAIREGEYQRNFAHLRRGPFSDEVGTLTEVFEDLLARVSRREQTLVREVQALKIEIDQNKRERQVAEVVETEGFVRLREKARAMRERRNNPV
ncbi:hypothetical protein DKM44_04145 [Deinococcus irradiatisoli]|uniref:histidine kinase n=1 Tax=Deinococcus irradiatisoli TaxID=2202254 RepID=A0A2Z3JEW6_9DEIO|nr:HAMP domain-containing protein [Deinococcus irradiatisoli]AWN22526.1 hypothetical protein DKM44_04145 [Deinococcus irradiatisoli]